MALALCAALLPVQLGAAPTKPPAPDPCQQALAFEKRAADGSAAPNDAYAAARDGLDTNEHCTDAEMHLITKGYLLSMLAISEHALDKGDWRMHFLQADALLIQCERLKTVPPSVTSDCRLQQSYNRGLASLWARESFPSPPPR
ncbi:MAG: hypothetical protein JOZ24_12490 [Candidatus Eremiobacteraeota bacterium]|nr:hypothetical protein [Candidatus Eremiobacteraeota bacterium]